MNDFLKGGSKRTSHKSYLKYEQKIISVNESYQIHVWTTFEREVRNELRFGEIWIFWNNFIWKEVTISLRAHMAEMFERHLKFMFERYLKGRFETNLTLINLKKFGSNSNILRVQAHIWQRFERCSKRTSRTSNLKVWPNDGILACLKVRL